MGEENKVYPQVGFVEVGMYQLNVRFTSEKDEQNTRRAAQAIKKRLKELSEGYDDSVNECSAILLLELMMENASLKSKLENSVDQLTIKNIDDLLDSVDDELADY